VSGLTAFCAHEALVYERDRAFLCDGEVCRCACIAIAVLNSSVTIVLVHASVSQSFRSSVSPSIGLTVRPTLSPSVLSPSVPQTLRPSVPPTRGLILLHPALHTHPHLLSHDAYWRHIWACTLPRAAQKTPACRCSRGRKHCKQASAECLLKGSDVRVKTYYLSEE